MEKPKPEPARKHNFLSTFGSAGMDPVSQEGWEQETMPENVVKLDPARHRNGSLVLLCFLQDFLENVPRGGDRIV